MKEYDLWLKAMKEARSGVWPKAFDDLSKEVSQDKDELLGDLYQQCHPDYVFRARASGKHDFTAGVPDCLCDSFQDLKAHAELKEAEKEFRKKMLSLIGSVSIEAKLQGREDLQYGLFNCRCYLCQRRRKQKSRQDNAEAEERERDSTVFGNRVPGCHCEADCEPVELEQHRNQSSAMSIREQLSWKGNTMLPVQAVYCRLVQR